MVTCPCGTQIIKDTWSLNQFVLFRESEEQDRSAQGKKFGMILEQIEEIQNENQSWSGWP